MKSVKIAAGLLIVAGVALSGCQSTKNALGLNKVVPDEFRVVTKAPLVVPPDYALRPPAPGEPRPQELQPKAPPARPCSANAMPPTVPRVKRHWSPGWAQARRIRSPAMWWMMNLAISPTKNRPSPTR